MIDEFEHTIKAPDGEEFTAKGESPLEAEEAAASLMRAAGRDPVGEHSERRVASALPRVVIGRVRGRGRRRR